jgi:hypothetical protein
VNVSGKNVPPGAWKAKTVEANSFLDSSIVRELEASGFINSLYEN